MGLPYVIAVTLSINSDSENTRKEEKLLLPMLRAVSKMIDTGGGVSPCEDNTAFLTQVKCAKTILDEIISSLETQKEIKDYYEDLKDAVIAMKENPNPVSKEKTQVIEVTKKQEPVYKEIHEPLPEVETNGDEWMITLDEGGGLKIVDFPVDGLIELDGKKMPYSEARGQKFKKARIL